MLGAVSRSDLREHQRDRGGGVAFLLAQLGAHAATAFAQRLEPLGLTPPQAGVLRRLAHTPGESQRALADALDMHATRLVALIDELERRGLVQRSRDPTDRRSYALLLTDDGRRMRTRLSEIAREHEHALTATLDEGEREQLAEVLKRIADEQRLTPGVHPGYRRLDSTARRP